MLSSEILALIYQATRRHTAEENSVHSHFNENLWSQDIFFDFANTPCQEDLWGNRCIFLCLNLGNRWDWM